MDKFFHSVFEYMGFRNLNRCTITGNRNYVFQDLQHNTITIHDTSELEELVRELHSIVAGKRCLQIIVLASTAQDFVENSPPALPTQRYGDAPEAWKPFADESVQELLLHFKNKSKLDVEIWFVNQWATTGASWTSDFKEDICEHTILIVDAFALHFEENRTFAHLFHHAKIGGFLMPVCASLTPDQKAFCASQSAMFQDVRYWWREKYDKPYMHIDLDIPYKALFFRRLADIAFKHLKFDEPKSTFTKSTALANKTNNVSNSDILD